MTHVAMKSPRTNAASLKIWVSGDTTCMSSSGKKCPTSVPHNALKTTTIARNISTLQPARNSCSRTNNPRSTRDLEPVIPDASTEFYFAAVRLLRLAAHACDLCRSTAGHAKLLSDCRIDDVRSAGVEIEMERSLSVEHDVEPYLILRDLDRDGSLRRAVCDREIMR